MKRTYTVQLFAGIAELAGQDNWQLDLSTLSSNEPVTAAQLLSLLADDCPAIAPLVSVSRLAVNGRYATEGFMVPVDAELAVIPPVSGG